MKYLALCLLITACSPLTSFERAALDAKWRLDYEAHSPEVEEWEVITAAKGYVGDCSNLCATINESYPQSKVYFGRIKDGRLHCMTCFNNRCVDTMHNGVFNYYSSMWAKDPIVLDI